VERRRLVAARRVRTAVALAAAVAALAAAGRAAPARASAAGAPPVRAAAYVVWSAVDGSVLAQRDAGVPRPIASITKLMTALVALDHLSLDDPVTVPRSATLVGESSIHLRTGEQMTVRDLLEGTLIPSANDAATALALAASGGSLTRFVGWMNDRAAALGMADTHFVNPHGLDVPGHVSSARDTVTLLRAALANPVIRRYAATERALLPGDREVETTDDLLARYSPLLAGKTGHTDGAGWAEVAAARSGPVTVYASVLGEPSRESRNDDLESLLEWGIAQYRRVLAVDAARVYATAPAPYGLPAVALMAPRSVVRLQRVGVPLVETVVAPTEASLPVKRGQRLGTVRIYERGRLVAHSPLVAARAVERPDALGRTRWYAARTLHHLASLVT
jgi:D-alanyl-D-alanine carboxypeptidase (penicillin-binding protein 5/6)